MLIIKSLFNKKNILTIALLVIGPLVITYLQYFIIGFTPWFPSIDYIPLWLLILFFAVVEFIIAYSIGDALTAEYRHRQHYFEGPLPEHQKEIIRQKKAPYFVSSLILLLSGLVILIVSLF
jgi:hypothetical protein